MWGDILTWALRAVQSDCGKKASVQALQAATQQLGKVLAQHAPDMAPTLNPLLNQIAQGAVAGIITRTGGK